MIHTPLNEDKAIIKKEQNILNQLKKIAIKTAYDYRTEKIKQLISKKVYAKLFSMIYFYLRYQRKISVYDLSLLTGVTKTNIYRYLEQLRKLGIITVKPIQTLKRYKPVKYVSIIDLEAFKQNIEFALITLETTLQKEERKKFLKDCLKNKLLDEKDDTIYVWEKTDFFTGKMKKEEGNIELLLTRMKASKELGLKFRVIGKKEDIIQFE